MIPDSFKQDLLNRVDIVDVVSRYVQLKKGGANYQGLCPFHNEKTPSFTVSPAKQFYHCFGCGAHGNAIGFLMAYASLGYVDAMKELAASVGMQVPESRPPSPAEQARREREPDLYAVMEKAMDFYRAELKKSQRAIDYLKGREVTGEIAARFGIGYAPDDWNGLRAAFPDYENKALEECGLVLKSEDKRYDRFRDRVMFPIFNSRGNAVIGFGGRVLGDGEPKYLNSPETALFQKGREVYGLAKAIDAARAEGRVLVVEGYMDVIALAQFGVGYAVATLGTATTPEHVSKLLRFADELVFCFDGDAAGRKAAWRALEVSLPHAPDSKPIRFLFLPESEDPDTFVRRYGKEEFEKRIAGAKMLSEFLLDELGKQCDLGSSEGRSKFLSLAKPYLQKIGGPELRIQVAKEAARLGGEEGEESRLLDLVRVPAFTRRVKTNVDKTAKFDLEERLFVLIIAKPSLALKVDLQDLSPDREETRALQTIVEALKRTSNSDNVSDAMLLELLGESPHRQLIGGAQATLLSLGLSVENATEEFEDTLAKLKSRIPAEEENLQKKVLKRIATPEEKRAYEEQFKGKTTPN